MKSVIICVLLFLVGMLQLQAYEPPKGITWDMTKSDIDSVFGIQFKPQYEKGEVFEAYEATDSPYLDEERGMVRGLLEINIYNTELNNLNFLISKDSRTIVRFEIEFSSSSDIPNIKQALITKYGKPDRGDRYSSIWVDDDGSEVAFELVPHPKVRGYFDFIGIVFNSPDYHGLVLEEKTIKSKKLEEKKKKEEEKRKKDIMESDF